MSIAEIPLRSKVPAENTAFPVRIVVVAMKFVPSVLYKTPRRAGPVADA